MAESNVLRLPAQGKSPSTPIPHGDHPLDALRRRRAFALMPTVRAVDGGFRVPSSCRELRYLVTQPNGYRVCTCPDFSRHEAEAGFRCKHILAVELALEAGRLAATNGHGNGHGPGSAADAPQGLPGSLSVLHRYQAGEDPVRLNLIKNTRGYSWEISVAERDPEAALSRLQELAQQMKHAFGEASES